jgi:hypothetical protein
VFYNRAKKKIRIIFAAAACALTALIPAQSAWAASNLSVSDYVEEAKDVARDNSHGYSQSGRWGRNYDCSSLVIRSLKRAGFDTNGASYTGDLKARLTKAGFRYIKGSSLKLSSCRNLQKGDILLANGHTEIYAGNGKLVGAHRNYDGRSGDSSGREISISRYRGGRWYGVLRYKGNTANVSIESVKVKKSAKKYKKGSYKTKAKNLTVRKKAKASSGKRYTLKKKGTRIKITKVSGSWGKVTYKGKTGWVAMKYLKKI